MLKTAFLEKFAVKDSDVVIMTELRTFKMTETIEEYIAAYEDMHDGAPDTINFDKAGPQMDFYNGLPTHIRRQCCCREYHYSQYFDFASVGHLKDKALAFDFVTQNELMTNSGNTIVWFSDPCATHSPH
ncbi:hypothetical protein DSO57_1007464 [Entomophthora muscae]|uniref:Uncharacterized protein n=1 Tax=Entomophthora muscae TaxID=34485 RepID=A0ACC2SWL4_9FUNG|nr:hypothetical protein DSO57_1007464 [Entomophthora muscae]